jgi:uncharacterized protein (DUF983 family)
MGPVETAPPGRIVLRGFVRRCPRCGAKGIFDGWFRLKERCPVCGYAFIREEGAATGSITMNFVATLSLMFTSLLAYVAWRGVTGDEVSFLPFAVACAFSAFVMPIVFFPISKSGWAGIDLAMRPLEPVEIAEAEAWRAVHGREVNPPEGRGAAPEADR